MEIQVFAKRTMVAVAALLILSIPLMAQKRTQNTLYKLPVEIQHISHYFDQNPPQNSTDSMTFSAFHYLMNLSENDTLKEQVMQIKNLLNENRANKELVTLFKLKRNIDSLNQVREKYMAGYWQYKQWLNRNDSAYHIIFDSVQTCKIDTLIYSDSVLVNNQIEKLTIYNDSLVQSINKTIAYFAQNEVLKWIKQTRQDTVNFYIVNIYNDSLLIKLYNHSPEMIHFDITDFWGTNIKAVVRNINKNSMKILVNDTPELDYDVDEKAKEAFGDADELFGDNKKMTLTMKPLLKERIKWLKYGNANFDVSQVQFSDSWAKGGESSLSYMAGMELNAIYKTPKYSWENKGVFKYGSITIKKRGEKDETKPTEDRMEFSSKYGHKLFGNYFISTAGTFRSQFFPFVKDDTITVSKFLSPAYITFALGIDYKPNNKFTLFVSPISSKTTIVNSNIVDPSKHGLKAGEKVRNEAGAILRANHKGKIWGNIEMENNLELFSNYVQNPQNVDVDWEFKLILPVNNFIRSTISTRLIYDDDMAVPKKGDGTTKAIQFKEMLTIGLAVKF